MDYSGKEGKSAVITTHRWPAGSKISLDQNKNLIMFVHPGCACSKASVAELSRLMSRHSSLKAKVVFLKTAKLDVLYKNNDLLKAAEIIPRTEIVFDENGTEAKAFGAETSGQSYLYNENGKLLFQGGLTIARGHEGKSKGQAEIEKQLAHESELSTASVFGCDIFDQIKKLTMVGK